MTIWDQIGSSLMPTRQIKNNPIICKITHIKRSFSSRAALLSARVTLSRDFKEICLSDKL